MRRSTHVLVLVFAAVLAAVFVASPVTARPEKPGKPTTTTSTSTSTSTTTAPTTTTSSTTTTTTAVDPLTLLAPPVTAPRPQPTQFDFGLQASPDSSGITGWMPNSGVPWKYAYTYIGGGLNRGGTTNWTSKTADATTPVTYAQTAAARGYIPVFSYYTIQSAIGPCATRVTNPCSEAEGDLSNLNSTSVMALYYNDFAQLMQRLGPGTYGGVTGYGQDTIVHIEPDLSGYAENAVLNSTKCFTFCTGVGNDPSLLKAAVASTGNPDVAGLPNTYRGFNQALLALRDKYAPNVRLALHISNWATGYDINSATTQLDAAGLGTKAGQFAALSGTAPIPGSASTYDLAFNDVANKDAGYYTYVLGKPRFWDLTNTVYPNFHQWETYLTAALGAAGRKAILWQVPLGNQYFQTMNNTPGHYQDNRVAYLFNHVPELISSGLVGVVFGRTQGDTTIYWNAQNDGVTNPASFCTTDGGDGTVKFCNSHVSYSTDDDGGFLRMKATDYYAAPLPL